MDKQQSTPSASPTYNPPAPSLSLLFSYLSRRDVFTLLIPACLVSVATGGIAPFMTKVVGEVFDALSRFPQDHDKHALLHSVQIGAIELFALGAGTLVMTSIMASLWMWVGEKNAMNLRRTVFQSVTTREMEWFDSHGSESEEGGNAGAGSLMSKFSRDTDDVRMATSMNSGMIIQYTTTVIAAFILAMANSWSLTLVILSSIPLLIIIQGFFQGIAMPLYTLERGKSTAAGTHIERAARAIATVKAFNAQAKEIAIVNILFDAAKAAYGKCCMVWGLVAGLSQFILFAMFVQGYWYGSKLVREGHISPGNVMGVFWACLVASSNLQLCVPLLVVQTKGKAAMVSLVTLVNTPTSKPAPPPDSPTDSLYKAPLTPVQQVTPPGKIHGSFSINNVEFSYPSRPDTRVLSIRELYLPSNETTFIVGGSGSGKSTVAQLLLRLYDPSSGVISFDDIDVRSLDNKFLRSHVAAVSQTCVLFDMTVHDNVAIAVAGSGRDPGTVSRSEVESVCRVALMHDFVRDLPQGYETRLGNGGTNLSGGQRQRLAIARAVLRDPTVLILDEATSALDATSRVLVFQALKSHRRNRTTVVITHDLSQITPDDFVYAMKDGRVEDQGYRSDLEKKKGEFRRMVDTQFQEGGFPVKDDEQLGLEPEDEDDDDEDDKRHTLSGAVLASIKRVSMSLARSASVARSRKSMQTINGSASTSSRDPPKWMFDAVADLANTKSSAAIHEAVQARRMTSKPKHLVIPPVPAATVGRSRRSFQTLVVPGEAEPRPSLQFEPMSPTTPNGWTNIQIEVPRQPYQQPQSKFSSPSMQVEDDDDYEADKDALRAIDANAAAKRRSTPRGKHSLDIPMEGITVVATPKKDVAAPLWTTAAKAYRTHPHKLHLFFGIFLCAVNGAMTPVFSVALSQLMALVGTGAKDAATIAFWGMVVLLIALGDGIAAGTKFFIMESSAMAWVTKLRSQAYDTVLYQDKEWFDEDAHAAEKLAQTIVKDADDARMLVATILSQAVVVVTMLSVGLIWAMVRGWQLTLVGIAIGPVFAICMMGQSAIMGRFELRAKRTREEVSRRYFEAVANVRAIRSMSLEGVFETQFEESLQTALDAGVRGAVASATGYGVANALIYIAEAVLFYVGAVMMANNTYSYLQLIEVLNLVVFTVSIAAQMMAFVPKIAKANQAAADMFKLLDYTQKTLESHGEWRYPIRGDITFNNVTFAYPSRPDVPVLKKATFSIKDGECVAIVGPSGSGKSTITALLQRLYEPSSGSVKIGRFNLNDADIVWLRSHLSVVSQNPALFDATIKENILYGSDGSLVPFYEVERAARDANLDDFIRSQPQGFDTPLGENASLISGGQAQRIQLARALVNGRANILLLDEFTSALDVHNQETLMGTVMKVREERTTVIVTHKLPVMRRCDRIIVVNDGEVVEQGSYEALMKQKGQFYTLAHAGDLVNE